MNKKIIIGVAAVIIIAGITIVGAKAMFGDAKTELPMEEQTENILNLQEPSSNSHSGEYSMNPESGESYEQENREYNP